MRFAYLVLANSSESLVSSLTETFSCMHSDIKLTKYLVKWMEQALPSLSGLARHLLKDNRRENNIKQNLIKHCLTKKNNCFIDKNIHFVVHIVRDYKIYIIQSE